MTSKIERSYGKETNMRRTISIRRMYGITEENARKRGQKLSKKYKFNIIDEFISQSLHIILAELDLNQIDLLLEDSMVLNVEPMPEFSLN